MTFEPDSYVYFYVYYAMFFQLKYTYNDIFDLFLKVKLLVMNFF